MATLAVTGRADLSDAQWAVLEPQLPRGKKPGRPPDRTKRQLIDGIRWRTRTGAPWRDVPPAYGPWQTVYGLFRRWQRNGTWRAILTALQGRADAAGLITWDVSVDSTVARAHQHAAGARRRGDLQAEPPGGVASEPTDHGLGRSRGGLTTKVHLACEQGQKPLSVVITAGQRGDSPQFQVVLGQVLSLLQPPVGDCAAPAPRASKAQRRCRSARRAAARRRARVPSRTRAGAPAGRPRSRRSPRPATQAPLETSPRIRRETDRMPRVCGTRSRPSSRAIRTSAPAAKGARSAAVAAAAYVPSSRTIASDPSPVVRHANDTAERHRLGRHRESAGVDGHPRRDRASVGRWRCISVRAAQCGVRRSAACVFPFR